jgi:uncharacterized protein (TIGR02996 family)
MTDPAAFLAAVRGGDYAAALVFADWLEEAGRGKDARRLRGCYRRWQLEAEGAREMAESACCLWHDHPDHADAVKRAERHYRQRADRRLTYSVAYRARKCQPAAAKAPTSTPSAAASACTVPHDGARSPRSRRAT